MTRRLALLLLVLAGLAVAPYPSTTASADCAGPQLLIDGHQAQSPGQAVNVKRGAEVTIDGRYFVDGCDDTGGGNVFGCTQDDPEPEAPLQDVMLVIAPLGADPTPLGTADADDSGTISWTVTIPADTTVGPVQLQAGYSEPFYVTVIA